MGVLAGIAARVRSFWRGLRRRRELAFEMEEEFRFHLDRRTADLIEAGVPAAVAKRRARLEFGSRDRFGEEGRESRGMRHVDELSADIRTAVRSLSRRPTFAVVAVLTLALGVGVNAAVFSLVNATLLRPLPFAEPDRLVIPYQTHAGTGSARDVRWSYPEYAALRSAVTTLSDITLYAAAAVTVIGEGDAIRANAELVSASYFDVLRIRPASGRAFLPEEDMTAGTHPVAILSHDLWRRHFGADASVVGRRILVNGVALVVVGVAPAGFAGLSGGRERM